MPTLDLSAVLGPIVGEVRDLLFPDVVAIDGHAETRSAKGAITGGYAELEAGVPAVVTRVSQTERGGEVTTNDELVKVLMEGVHVVPLDGRIRRTSRAGTAVAEAYDVVGVSRDPVAVTTSVFVRLTTPPRVA